MHSAHCTLLFITLVLPFFLSCTGNGVTTEPKSRRTITWEDAEKIAETAFTGQTKWAVQREIERCCVMGSLGLDRNAVYMFLVKAGRSGPGSPLFAKIFVDSLTGETYPSDGSGNPLHEISSVSEYESYHDAGWVIGTFAVKRAGESPPLFWSLVQSTPLTSGYMEELRPDGIQEKIHLWEMNVTGQLPVWLVTDADGDDFLVFPNGQINQVFDLALGAKKRLGHLDRMAR